MDDMRFFHHYLTAGYPYLPDGCDTVWITEIPLLAHQASTDRNALLLSLKEGFDPRTRTRFSHLTLTSNDDAEDLEDDPGDAIDVGINMCVVKRFADALRALIPLLQHECHQNYHAAILDAAEALQRRAWVDAFNSFQKTYVVLCTIDEVSFQNYIISPSVRGAGAGTGRRPKWEGEVEKNAMFLLLFMYLTALKVAMCPIIWRVIPERALFPQMILPQVSWLIDISARISPVLRGHVVLPLEVITRVGAEYGVFKSVFGERVREELTVRAEEMG
ncbi:hypothetical protein RJZ56_004910 [Blastomyces dermatitidis]|uniref:Uncharacterized protein n=1 Tax=Ajellomyces dermatitidis (strain ATCC 18188 / CBS 674.68) TaxID=653446 RepID=A0A0J9ENG9_AJEDA|nr:hypothetical protein BDDG_12198 [Blastomyces dermatitidis ATCC 18188]